MFKKKPLQGRQGQKLTALDIVSCLASPCLYLWKKKQTLLLEMNAMSICEGAEVQ